MPQQRRLRRIGSAATAVSATALVMTVFGSPAAHAGTSASAAAAAAAARPCKKGTDPASTLENWKCQLDNLRDRVDHHNTPSPTPTPTKKPGTSVKGPGGNGAGDHDNGGGGGGGGKTPKGGDGGGGPKVTVPTGNAPSLMNDRPPQPLTAAAPDGRETNLTGLLPTPQVAGPDGAPAAGALLPQTHLVSPVAASEPTGGGQMVWVAGSAAVIGAAAALNLSHIARTMRRRPRTR
ncbi:hypothetical protein [Actinomadura harenae]|uniref:Uncharacterized protein n=1 Tax=Actinomadura harenae TaxID=2483351 RepID=A0A3M2LIH3_9ACTN|nr:hypothetical protein [Actinomadura harenae]RMI36916.1 hypothetical protein EBO15_37230 [Actinomadura harenae]